MTPNDNPRDFVDTLPLFGPESSPPLDPDPHRTRMAFAPDSTKLEQLREHALATVSSPPTAATPSRKRVRESLPPAAPDWMQAARMLSQSLESVIRKGQATPLEQAAIARLHAAWVLGNVSENHILRVAHLVARAHRAIRETQRQELDAAVRDCAGVLHAGLPSEVRRRVPMERVLYTVRALRETTDPWVAVVEATAELVGWKDLGRFHAAALLRGILEGSK
ncbi:MAG: hypothetical protein QM784_15495 [Polyangiaceae bacterium]